MDLPFGPGLPGGWSIMSVRRNRRSVLHFAVSLIMAGALLLLLIPLGELLHADPIMNAAPAAISEPILVAAATPGLSAKADAASASGLTELAGRDPMALARLALERYERDVREYRCMLIKQERVGGKLGPVQEIAVQFRDEPYSVYMTWLKNVGDSKRALFINTPDYVDSKGRKFAQVEPAGAIIRLFVKKVNIPIRGARARSASRRFIDEFGFRSTLDLLLQLHELASKNGVLDLRYGGESEIDGRPTHFIVRYLPYAGPNGRYPDAKMVAHFDQETMMPVAVYSYADRAGTELLGSYLFTQIELNPGFSDQDFQF